MFRAARARAHWIVLGAMCSFSVAPLGAQDAQFRRGDSNADGQFNLSDAVFTLSFLFLGTATPTCADALDADDSGSINLTDAVFGLGYLFLGGPPPLPPFGDCGVDPTADPLDCNTFVPCEGPAEVLNSASKSSTIALSDDENYVVMVNPDDDSISIFSTADNSLSARVTTGDEPSAVVIHPDSTTAFVANRAAATVIKVWDIDKENPRLSNPTPVGSEPTGLALSPTGATLFVAEFAEGRISVIDTATMALTDVIEAPLNPRGIAVTNDGDESDDDEFLIVPEFFGDQGPGAEATDTSRTGRVRIYQLSNLAPTAPIIFAPIDSGFVPNGTSAGTVMTSPNQLYSVAVTGGKIYVTSVSASPKGPPVFNGNVYPVVYVGDLASRTEDRSIAGTTNLARRIADAIPSGVRFFLADMVDVSFVGSTNVGYFLGRGSDVIQRVVFDPTTGVTIGSNRNVQIDIGKVFPDETPACQTPSGIVVSGSATRAYVNCWVSRRLGVINLGEQVPLTTVEASPPPVTEAEQAVERGKRFYFTGRGRWSSEAWSGCGTCHPDGLTDNITWSFATGPRQTTSMDGTFSHGPGPQKQRILNWTAVFDELHDFERNTRDVSGGKGAVTRAGDGFLCGDVANEVPLALGGNLAQPVREVQDNTPSCTDNWDDIEAFTRTIRPPAGLKLMDLASVARGALLFGEPTVQVNGGGCVRCHGGPGWTVSRLFFTPSSEKNAELKAQGAIRPQPAGEDNTGAPIGLDQVACVLRKVGTFGIPGDAAATDALEVKANGIDRAQGAGGFNIPSLYGLAMGAPYLHHGQARSLAELFIDPKWEQHRTAGNANFLVGDNADQDLTDLINFLCSIDATIPEQNVPDTFDTCPENSQ